MNEVSANKAYSSRSNVKFIDSMNITPFIPFKKNVTGKKCIWKKMYHYFMLNNDEFNEHTTKEKCRNYRSHD
jgi:hypothetical protein